MAAVAFQCELPKPWEIMTPRCYNRGVFWIVYCVVDMTSDVAIVMLAVNLVAYLRIPFTRKVIVVACFAPRVLVIGASLARLIYLYPIAPHDNPRFALWTPLLCTQVQVCLAISTACIPYIKPFFAVPEGVSKGLEGGRRFSKSVRHIYAFGAQTATSSWRKKFRKLSCIEASTSDDLEYSCAGPSPRIPSPPPISPLSPPRCATPTTLLGQVTIPVRQLRERGLTLQIPNTGSYPTVGLTPQTASTHTSSPYVVSPLYPQPLLFFQTRSPVTLSRNYSPPPVNPSAHCESSTTERITEHLSVKALPQKTGYSLFPSPTPGRYAFVPRDPKPLVQKPSSKQLSCRVQERTDGQPSYPERSSSLKCWYGHASPAIKFAVGPSLTTARPSTTILSKAPTPKLRDNMARSPITPSSPFSSPSRSTPTAVAVDEAPSPQQARNKRVLSPQNSSRLSHINSMAPVKIRDSWRSTVYLGDAPNDAPHPRWELREIPTIQDARSSLWLVL